MQRRRTLQGCSSYTHQLRLEYFAFILPGSGRACGPKIANYAAEAVTSEIRTMEQLKEATKKMEKMEQEWWRKKMERRK